MADGDVGGGGVIRDERKGGLEGRENMAMDGEGGTDGKEEARL